MNTLFRLLPFLLLSSCWIGNILSGPWLFLGPITIFIVHPLMDNLIGNKVNNDDGPQTAGFLNMTLYLIVPMLFLFLVHGFFIFQSLESTSDKLVLILSLGLGTGGLGITAAHELIHRPTPWQRGLGVFLLSLVNYSYFRIEHVHGHHKYVSTPEDPASAPFGMTLYSFLPKTLVGSLTSAWRYEVKRLKRKNGMKKVIENRMFHYLAFSLIWSFLSYQFMGLAGLGLFWGQSAVAILLLEIINYVEHYGLMRTKLPNGNWEPVKEWHSWDSDYAITNFSLFNLGKHSNHHARASVEFTHLINKDGNPTLPFGYSSAILLALFPPLWHRVMDPEVKKREAFFALQS